MTWGGTVTFIASSYYNSSDFNRESANVEYLRQQLEANGYPINLTHPVEQIGRQAFPTVTRINNLRQNILDLIAGFYYPDGPEIELDTERRPRFDYTDANKLEQALQHLYDTFQALTNSYIYCGTFASGEEVIR